MKKNLLFVFILFFFFANAQQTPQQKLTQAFAAGSKNILVTAHRGDWRNTPENSVQSLVNCIEKGIDVCEFDLKQTKDGHLIIMHDKTIDRTTNGKGKPEDYTLEEIRKFKLLSGTGHPTKHAIPTFEEMLRAAKNKIIIDIDKGYEYYDKVMVALTKYNMLPQTILNIYGLPYDSLVAKHGSIPQQLTLQLIINPKNPDIEKVIETYKPHKRTIVQIIFENDDAPVLKRIPELKKKYAIWFNSIWPEQNGGHDDDQAVEEKKPDKTWGWLVKHRPDFIQSDRPVDLLNYLKRIGVHK